MLKKKEKTFLLLLSCKLINVKPYVRVLCELIFPLMENYILIWLDIGYSMTNKIKTSSPTIPSRDRVSTFRGCDFSSLRTASRFLSASCASFSAAVRFFLRSSRLSPPLASSLARRSLICCNFASIFFFSYY